MINLIASVGEHGEIGLNGELPWARDRHLQRRIEEDAIWFANVTRGGVLVVGSETATAMADRGMIPADRDIEIWTREHGLPPHEFIAALQKKHRDRDIWIAGGTTVYRLFMPMVQRAVVSRVPWTGKADRFMPPLQRNWSYCGGPAH